MKLIATSDTHFAFSQELIPSGDVFTQGTSCTRAIRVNGIRFLSRSAALPTNTSCWSPVITTSSFRDSLDLVCKRCVKPEAKELYNLAKEAMRSLVEQPKSKEVEK